MPCVMRRVCAHNKSGHQALMTPSLYRPAITNASFVYISLLCTYYK